MSIYYEITVEGHLDSSWSNWFASMTLIHLSGNQTQLAGVLLDQAALYGVIERIRDLNLTLISITQRHTPDTNYA